MVIPRYYVRSNSKSLELVDEVFYRPIIQDVLPVTHQSSADSHTVVRLYNKHKRNQ